MIAPKGASEGGRRDEARFERVREMIVRGFRGGPELPELPEVDPYSDMAVAALIRGAIALEEDPLGLPWTWSSHRQRRMAATVLRVMRERDEALTALAELLDEPGGKEE